MLFSLKFLTSFLYVSVVTQLILITFFARHLCNTVHLCCVSYWFYHFSVVYNTMYNTSIGGGLWIFVELGFPSMEFSFVSFVNKLYRLCFSILVSGVFCCVLCIFSF
jgi:hypothetical protein